MTAPSDSEPIAGTLELAAAGDRDALEDVLRNVQPLVHRLALRFFGCPDHAQDATQEVLLHLITHLGHFDGRSRFTTWVYRVATNKFLSMKRSRAEVASTGLEDFERDLAERGVGHPDPAPSDLDREILAEEVKIGCTLAMLLCLDRPSRMAYILGAIGELDHVAASDILGCRPAAFRKRLERARNTITGLMRRRCGVFDPANACHCSVRIPVAIAKGRVDPQGLVFATSREQARRFPAVLTEIRRLEELQRAAAIYRSHPDPAHRGGLSEALDRLLGARTDDRLGDDTPTQG